MSIPVPLGVRIYTYGRTQFDRWVTPWVSDLTFRSTAPGGFASATIKLARPRTMQTPEVVTGTATASGNSSTPDYLVCADADAADINIGDKVWIYTSGGAIRFGGARFRITSKPSAFGFTNLTFTPPASGVTNTGDVMRAASPGHFSYADLTVFSEICTLFNRVQVVDLRTAEIVWEGRIEDPQRDSDDDSWTLGCLGSMVVASDIQRPIFFIDGDFNNWYSLSPGGYMDIEIRTPEYAIFKLKDGINYGTGINVIGSWMFWGRGETADCYVARFDITYGGSYINGNLRTDTYVANGDLAGQQNSIDVTAWNAGSRKTNIVGTDFSSTSVQFVGFQDNIVTSGSITAGTVAYGTARDAHIQVMRLDRNGTKLTAASNYPSDYVTVPQIVEDVVGRYLVSGWLKDSLNVPFAGQVRTGDLFIDTSATAQITHLTYYDGATAADILGDLMASAQPNAYWAIWESNWRATIGSGGINDFGFRFEWAEWPQGWGYYITSADGLDEKPNGENSHNFLFYKYQTDIGFPFNMQRLQSYWDAANSPPLQDMNTVRALTVAKEPATSNAFNEAAAKITEYGRTKNAGTVTVKRPVLLHDTGATSNSAASRMLDPWQIRPGKLARIGDAVAPSRANEFLDGFGRGIVDTFSRTAVNGWDNADSGQPYVTAGGVASDYAVASGIGTHTLTTTNATRRCTIAAPSPDVDMTVDIAFSALATGASLNGGLMARSADGNNMYMARVEVTTAAAVNLTIRKRVASVETQLATFTAAFTHTAGAWYRVRMQTEGSALRAKIWQATAAEPDAWQVTAADTDLTAASDAGTRSIASTGNTNVNPVVRYDNLTVTGLGNAGTTALDGVVFRVVATEYRASDNSCTLELDQVATWRTETQIASSAAKKPAITVKG